MLRYKGGGFIVGIPARDLTEKEVESMALRRKNPQLRANLIACGLYEAKLERPRYADKALRPSTEDKED
jgi:hypothetical protein